MSTRLHQWILALAVTGITAATWAQSAPDATAGRAGDDERGHGWHHPHDHHHDGGRGGGDEHGAWHRPGGMMGRAGMAFRGLNLTPEQRQKMRIIVMTARLQMMQQAGAHRPGGAGDMAALVNPGDPNYNAAVQAAKKRAADRIQRMSDLRLQLYNVLTPEQKTEFTRRVAGWKARLAQRDEDPRSPSARDQPAPAAR
jgi:Spy/CpxP family protein refolding chaperone